MFWFSIILAGIALAALKLFANWTKTAKGKGKIGEILVETLLKKLGPGYDVLNNLTFVIDGDTTQIDHVVISTKGVFTIETKNYQGKIFGQASDPTWTQKMHGKTFKFQNPIRQNFKHLKFLAEKCGVKESAIVPLVVFTGLSEFPKGMPEGVFLPKDVVSFIQQTSRAQLNNAQTHTIRRNLEELGQTTREKTAVHLQNLQKKHG